MTWLLGLILAAGLAHGQPPTGAAPAVALSVPQTAVACVPTEFTVTVDNLGRPAGQVAFELYLEVDRASSGSPSQLDFRPPGGEWQRLMGNRTPAVELPAGSRVEYEFRAAFPGGRHTIRIRLFDAFARRRLELATATAQFAAAGPEIRVQRPVPDRITAAEALAFGVTVWNGAGVPPLALEVVGGVSTVELSRRPGSWPSWWPAADGSTELGALPPEEARSLRVRVSAAPGRETMPVEVRLVSGGCVAASDGFGVAVDPAPPPEPSSAGLMFGLGAAVGAVGALAVLRVRRRVTP